MRNVTVTLHHPIDYQPVSHETHSTGLSALPAFWGAFREALAACRRSTGGLHRGACPTTLLSVRRSALAGATRPRLAGRRSRSALLERLSTPRRAFGPTPNCRQATRRSRLRQRRSARGARRLFRLRFQSVEFSGVIGRFRQQPFAKGHDFRQLRGRLGADDPIAEGRGHGDVERPHEPAANQVPCRGAVRVNTTPWPSMAASIAMLA